MRNPHRLVRHDLTMQECRDYVKEQDLNLDAGFKEELAANLFIEVRHRLRNSVDPIRASVIDYKNNRVTVEIPITVEWSGV